MEVGRHQMEEQELGRYWGQRLVRCAHSVTGNIVYLGPFVTLRIHTRYSDWFTTGRERPISTKFTSADLNVDCCTTPLLRDGRRYSVLTIII
jgi:hypothetical protein